MPAANKKPLYLAKGIHDLNEMADAIPKISPGQCKMFAKSANKVFKSAVEQNNEGDEEKAYVLYMKYFNIITAIKQTADYKKDESFYKDYLGMKNCVKAIDTAEALCTQLKNRYDEREAEEVSKRLESLDSDETRKNDEAHIDKNGDIDVTDSKRKDEDESHKDHEKGSPMGLILDARSPEGSISVQNTYTLLKEDKQLLLMDVRTTEDFEQSHINHRSCISVPCDIVPPGTTVKSVEQHLPSASVSGWGRRADMDAIVLFDWRSCINSVSVGSVLRSLRDALFKWDSQVTLKTAPLVMEGGYEEWLNFYPTMTTNAHVSAPPNYADVSMPAKTPINNIDYDLDLGFLMTPDAEDKKKKKKNEKPTVNVDVVTPKSAPTVDRRQKPKVISLENVSEKSDELPRSVQSADDIIRLNSDLKVNVKSPGDEGGSAMMPVTHVAVKPPTVQRSLKPKQNNIDEAERQRRKKAEHGENVETSDGIKKKEEEEEQHVDEHKEAGGEAEHRLKEDAERLEERQRNKAMVKVEKHKDDDDVDGSASHINEAEERRKAEVARRLEDEKEKEKSHVEADRLEAQRRAERKQKEDRERQARLRCEEEARRAAKMKEDSEKKLLQAKKAAEERERVRKAESERLIQEREEQERKRCEEAELKKKKVPTATLR